MNSPQNLANNTLYRATTDLQRVKATLMQAEGQLPVFVQSNPHALAMFTNVQENITLVISQIILLRHFTNELQTPTDDVRP